MLKSRAPLSLVHPILEYASTVWDPYTIKDSDQLEKVQRSAAQWVCSNYDWKYSVTSLLENLQWPTLEHRRKVANLITLYKSIYNLTALKIPPYYSITTRSTRRCHDMHNVLPTLSTDSYKFSYFPFKISDWNNLPTKIIESNCLELFVLSNLNQYFNCVS